MVKSPLQTAKSPQPAKPRPFRRAVLRGLGVVMPPLLTLVLFIWAWATIDSYVLQPLEYGIGRVVALVSMQSSVHDVIPADALPDAVKVVDKRGEPLPVADVMRAAESVNRITDVARARGWRVLSFEVSGKRFVPTSDHKWIAESVYEVVKQNPGDLTVATASSSDLCKRYVSLEYLPRWRTIPVFLLVFVSLLYLLGSFLAAGVGRIFVNAIEALIARLPIVRNVYSAVKQVTDFVFSEREIEFNRVVAVQYPSKGIWSIGFVTGESMLDIRSAANEPVLSVLMPTSPMPATGFTITVRKSETIDLELTVDQAIQFIVSCGVVVPQHQQLNETSAKISEAISRRLQSDGIGSTSATTVRRVVEQPRRSERESDSQPSKNGDGVDPSVQHPPHEPTQNTDADDA